MKIKADLEGARTIRTLAKQMKTSRESISTSTKDLETAYNQYAKDLGIYGASIKEMLELVKSSVKKSTEAITILAPKMEKTADKIEVVVNKKMNETH